MTGLHEKEWNEDIEELQTDDIREDLQSDNLPNADENQHAATAQIQRNRKRVLDGGASIHNINGIETFFI